MKSYLVIDCSIFSHENTISMKFLICQTPGQLKAWDRIFYFKWCFSVDVLELCMRSDSAEKYQKMVTWLKCIVIMIILVNCEEYLQKHQVVTYFAENVQISKTIYWAFLLPQDSFWAVIKWKRVLLRQISQQNKAGSVSCGDFAGILFVSYLKKSIPGRPD